MISTVLFQLQVVDVFNPSYEPSFMDIFNLEGFPFTLSDVDFTFTLTYGDEIENKDKLIRSTQLFSASFISFFHASCII